MRFEFWRGTAYLQEHKVPSQYVVNIPIVIVIDTIRFFVETVAIFSALAGIVPEVVLDIRMVVAKPVVEDCDDYALAPRGDSPCLRDIQIDAFFRIEFFQ